MQKARPQKLAAEHIIKGHPRCDAQALACAAMKALPLFAVAKAIAESLYYSWSKEIPEARKSGWSGYGTCSHLR